MNEKPAFGHIRFSSVADPNTWRIDGELKALVFASPSEAKRAEELFSAMQREIHSAYRLGQERMRERCAEECDGLRERWAAKHGGDTAFDAAYCTGALSCSHVIRALPVEEW